jgi:hypothetical protein
MNTKIETLEQKAAKIKAKMEELKPANPTLTEGQLRILAVRTIAQEQQENN